MRLPEQVLILFIFVIFSHFCKCIYLSNSTEKVKVSNDPALWTEEGFWGPLLEQWVLTNYREKRVMQIPLHQNDVLTIERGDNHNSENPNRDEKQSKITPGKIVHVDNTKRPPTGPQVSETDLYLLGAIEKLVYKVDFMEKRLRRVEEMLYYVMAGNRVDQVPCPGNFTRVGSNCYYFSTSAGREHDWKAASKQCRKVGAVLAEMETIEENQDIIAYIQSNHFLRGKDFWTGGLNPGLLWIWSNSARPVAEESTSDKNKNKKPMTSILGDGRCLRLAYNPALRSYAYRGSDCGTRYSYICEAAENSSSNELRRLGRARKILKDEL